MPEGFIKFAERYTDEAIELSDKAVEALDFFYASRKNFRKEELPSIETLDEFEALIK